MDLVVMQKVLPAGLSLSSRALAILALSLILLPQAVPAHPPSDMRLSFDQGTRVLSVTITHVVVDPATHYVKRVLITAGGSVVSDNGYTSQPAPGTFTYTYRMPGTVGGEVRVTAECSITGSTARSIQVPPQAEQGATQGSPVTGPPSSPPGTPPVETGPGFLALPAAFALAARRFYRMGAFRP